MISLAAVMALLVDEGMGVTTCVGNHANVSVMHLDMVSHTVQYHW